MPGLIRTCLKSAFRLLLKGVLKVVAYPVRRRLRAFEAATHDPATLQEQLLLTILRHQAGTAFGIDHKFADIRSPEEFAHNVPVAGYDYIDPYIRRVRKGETNALLADSKIHMFALTSGTTDTRKYIPVNDAYLADYRRGWNIWGLKVFRDHSDVKMRPIVQLSGEWDECRSESGIPCGSVTGLTAQMQKRIIRWLYCVPACVGSIKDPKAKYYVALRLSLPRQVGMIIAANPSTMINLARLGDQEKESLIRDLHDGTLTTDIEIAPEIREALDRKIRRRHVARAQELEEVVARTGTLYPKDYWTKGCLLGNWTGGSVGAYLRHYPTYFGDFHVRDVGLIASEGRMTIPFEDNTPAGVLDVTSHYFEFLPEAEADSPNPTILRAHEVQEGQRYFILLTTAYGLYRYHIHDLVRVTGFFNKTPLIEFLSKGANFSNLTGEKLSEYQVTHSMVDVLREMNLTLSTYSLAPCWPNQETGSDFEQPFYGLFVEEADLRSPQVGEQLAERLDRRLRHINVEYDSKRESERLRSVQTKVLSNGFWRQWDLDRLRKNGGSLDQYKHPCLINDPQFANSLRS